MADIGRIPGLTFKGVHISNDFDMSTPFLLDVTRPTTPSLLFTELVSPNRHGGETFSNRYEDQDITAVIGIYGKTAADRMKKVRELFTPWVGGQMGKLSFDDDPTLFYEARIFESMERQEDDVFSSITVTFRASYCKYEFYQDGRDHLIYDLRNATIENVGGILVNKGIFEGIVEATTKTITHGGNFDALPTIIISGTATRVSVKINDIGFNISGINKTVYVDCNKMIVYTLDGEHKVNKLGDFTGVFPGVAPGENIVKIDGENMNVSVEINYRNTYIV